jgi:hypothetical protein
MKKSELRKTIRESIKQLMNEQSGYIKVNARTCNGGMTYGSLCVSAGAQVGDVYHVPSVNRDVFVREIIGSCPAYHYTHYGQPYQISAQNCSNCCSNSQWQSQFPNFGGACTLNCGSTLAGSCNPSAWSNHANWTSTFTNTVNNLNPNNPNQPCNFLNNKIAQFTANLQGTGQGGYQNMQNCKLDLANQLHTQNNC